MAQLFFKVDPTCFRLYSQVEEANNWMQSNNLRTADHGILLVIQQQDLGFLTQNRFNFPRLFPNYKFTVTGFRKEKSIKDDIIQMVRAFGASIVKIQTVEQMKAQIERRDMNYYIIVYQPKLLLKLLELIPEYQDIIINKCRSIYALFHVCGQSSDDFNAGQYLDEEFTRLKLLENSNVGISKIPSKATDDRILFKKISSYQINKIKYITFRLHSKTNETEYLLKEEFYMYYKQDIKQFYDLIIPYQVHKGQYKILQNQFPIDTTISYWSLYLAFSKQVLLCVQDVETIQDLKQLMSNLIGSMSQSAFDKQFEDFSTHFTLIPFSKTNKLPTVLLNRCFFVLVGKDRYQVPREFHTKMTSNPINLRNALWLVTVFLQCSSQKQLIQERQIRAPIYKSQSQSQYSQVPYNNSKQLPIFCCELRNSIATVLFSNINIFLHEVQMNKNPINPDEIINIIYTPSINQQEKAIFKQQLIRLLNIDEKRHNPVQIESYDDLLQNALANNFQMQLAIQSQSGFDNQGAVVIKSETDSIQNMAFGTYSQVRYSPSPPRSADDLEDDQFGIE